MAPGGASKLYWKGVVTVAVERLSLGEGLEVVAVAKRLRQLGALERIAVAVTVPVESVGLLFIDGKLARRRLSRAAYAFWNFQKNVSAEVIPNCVCKSASKVSGQELLTRDKVSLRVNLAASIHITDAVAAHALQGRQVRRLSVPRTAVPACARRASAKTLDELLGDKASLDGDIYGYVRGRMGELGIEVLGVGVKDVILPGEMKEILNSVVQAEKAAQANTIRRREEANAMRSALNTARLMEESPTLMRLKELETLEKVTEKVDKLTVFGGLDGVLNQLVKLRKDA